MTKEEESRLIKEAQKGRERAFEELVLENQNRVYALSLKICGNKDDAFDLSQEAFLKAYTSLESFRGDSRFSVWLYRLTYNVCIDFLRKKRSASVTSLNRDEDEPELDFQDERPLPEEEVERRELRATVREAMLQLPDEKREILVMREFSGMSYVDIAESLGIDLGTVKSRISRARIALAEILSKTGTFSGVFPSKETKGGRCNG